MSLSGDLKDFALSEVLQFLSRGRHTGVLTLTAEQESELGSLVPSMAKIYFHDGRVAFASAGFRDRLGHRLILKGLLSREVLRQLLNRQQDAERPKPFGAMLVEENLLCPDVLREEIRAQVLQVIACTIDWRQGSFRFDCAPEAHVEHLHGTDHALSTEHLLLEICRQQDEELSSAVALMQECV
jgi:hypothetical protein